MSADVSVTGFPLPSWTWMMTDPDVVPMLVDVVEKVWGSVRNTRTGFMFVSVKLADVAPAALAVTVYVPVVPVALKLSELAMPAALVTAVHEVLAVPEARQGPPVPFAANLPVAPFVGVENVTVTPDTGLPLESVTSTDKGAEKAVLIFVD